MLNKIHIFAILWAISFRFSDFMYYNRIHNINIVATVDVPRQQAIVFIFLYFVTAELWYLDKIKIFAAKHQILCKKINTKFQYVCQSKFIP